MSDDAWVVVRPSGRPARVARLHDGFVLGRIEDVDLQVPSETVGHRHARFEERDGAWQIVDLIGPAGVWLNGEQVRTATVEDGDVIRLGVVELTFHQRLPPLFDVRRRGSWLACNETFSSTVFTVARGAEHGGWRVASGVRGAVPLGLEVIEQVEDVAIVEDIAGVPFLELIDATPVGARIDPSVVAQAARAALEATPATSLNRKVLSPWLTFDGRVVPMRLVSAAAGPWLRLRALGEALEPGLSSVEAFIARCAREPAPPPAQVAGLLANVLPARRAAHASLIEELGLFTAEKLGARVR